jgi:hypothetical protein
MPQAVNAIVIEEEILPGVDIDIPTPGASRSTNGTSAPFHPRLTQLTAVHESSAIRLRGSPVGNLLEL